MNGPETPQIEKYNENSYVRVFGAYKEKQNGIIIMNEEEQDKKGNTLIYEQNQDNLPLNRIICSKCKENCFINIVDYKFNLYGCKNNHNINNILFENYKSIFPISKIKCNECKSILCNNSEFYKCFNCNINICKECKLKHNKEHKIIYNGDILPNNIINNVNNRNYHFLKNINEFKKFNNILMNDIDNINNDDINNKFQKLMIIYDKMSKINNNNYIIAEINIKEEEINHYIRIINSFEQGKREEGLSIDDEYENCNEKDIMENCEIKINNEIIPFSYFHGFKEKGKNIIKYTFNSEIAVINSLFSGCEKINKIDMSNFNSKNAINMRSLFYGCKSLTELDLSNFNTQNANNMRSMFYECESLKNLDLSNFKTNNVQNMEYMFYRCKSLNNLDLSNLDTKNVNNMRCMFCECESLKNLKISNFNTANVKNMEYMFYRCKNLNNLDLSNFNTNNVNNMRGMFYECESLKNLNLSNFNTDNVQNMENMFYRCKCLINLDLSNFNTKNVNNMANIFSECVSLTKNTIIIKDNKLIQQFNNCSIY